MKQDISALMDGELFDDEAETLFDQLKRKPDAQEEWHIYHLISDVLHQPAHVHPDIGATMKERLQAEPTVLAPRSNSSQKARWFAFSAAASVLALTLVAWLSVQVGNEVGPQIAVLQLQQPASIKAASYSVNSGVNDYLMAHQEFSPSANVQGATAYIRTMAGQ